MPQDDIEFYAKFGFNVEGTNDLIKHADAIDKNVKSTENYDKALDKLDKTVDKTDKTLNEAEKTIKDVADSQEELRKATDKSTDSFHKAQDKLEDYTEGMEDLADSVEDASEALDTMKETSDRLPVTIDKSAQSLSTLADRADEVSQSARQAASGEQEMATQSTNLGSSLGSTTSMVGGAVGQFSAFGDSASFVGTALGGVGEMAGSLTEGLSVMGNKSASSGDKMAALGGMAMGAVAGLMAAFEIISSIVEAMDEQIKKNGELAQALTDADKAYQKTSGTMQDQLAVIDSLGEGHNELKNKLIASAGNTKLFNEELNKAKATALDARAAAKSLEIAGMSPLARTILDVLNPALRESRNLFAKTLVVMEDLQQQASGLIQTLSAFEDRTRAEAVQQEIRNLEYQISELEATLQTLDDESKRQAMQTKLAGLRQQLRHKQVMADLSEEGKQAEVAKKLVAEAETKMGELQADADKALENYQKNAESKVLHFKKMLQMGLDKVGSQYKVTLEDVYDIVELAFGEKDMRLTDAIDTVLEDLRDFGFSSEEWTSFYGGIAESADALMAMTQSAENLSLYSQNVERAKIIIAEYDKTVRNALKTSDEFADWDKKIEGLQAASDAVDNLTDSVEGLNYEFGQTNALQDKIVDLHKTKWVKALEGLGGYVGEKYGYVISNLLQRVDTITFDHLELVQGQLVGALGTFLHSSYSAELLEFAGFSREQINYTLQPLSRILGYDPTVPKPEEQIRTFKGAVESLIPIFEELGMSAEEIQKLIETADVIDDINQKVEDTKTKASVLLNKLKRDLARISDDEARALDRLQVVSEKWLTFITRDLTESESRAWQIWEDLQTQMKQFPELSEFILEDFRDKVTAIYDEIDEKIIGVWEHQRDAMIDTLRAAKTEMDSYKSTLFALRDQAQAIKDELEGKSRSIFEDMMRSTKTEEQLAIEDIVKQAREDMERVKYLTPEQLEQLKIAYNTDDEMKAVNDWLRERRYYWIQQLAQRLGQTVDGEQSSTWQAEFKKALDAALVDTFGAKNILQGTLDSNDFVYLLRIPPEIQQEWNQISKDIEYINSLIGGLAMPPDLHTQIMEAGAGFTYWKQEIVEINKQLDALKRPELVDRSAFDQFSQLELVKTKAGGNIDALQVLADQAKAGMLINAETGEAVYDDAANTFMQLAQSTLGINEEMAFELLKQTTQNNLTMLEAVNKIQKEIAENDPVLAGMVKYEDAMQNIADKTQIIKDAFSNVRTHVYTSFESAFFGDKNADVIGIIPLLEATGEDSLRGQLEALMQQLGIDSSEDMLVAFDAILGGNGTIEGFSGPDLPDTMYEAGINANKRFAEGIDWSGPGSARDAVIRLAQDILDYLKVSSPAKKGPLSLECPSEFTKRFVKLLGDGFVSAQDVLKGRLEDIASAMVSAFDMEDNDELRGNIQGIIDYFATYNKTPMSERMKKGGLRDTRDESVIREMLDDQQDVNSLSFFEHIMKGAASYAQHYDWNSIAGWSNDRASSVVGTIERVYAAMSKLAPDAQLTTEQRDAKAFAEWLTSKNKTFATADSRDIKDFAAYYPKYLTEQMNKMLATQADYYNVSEDYSGERDAFTGLPKEIVGSKWFQAFTRKFDEGEFEQIGGLGYQKGWWDKSRLGMAAEYDLGSALSFLKSINRDSDMRDQDSWVLYARAMDTLSGFKGTGGYGLGGVGIGWTPERVKQYQKIVSDLFGFELGSLDKAYKPGGDSVGRWHNPETKQWETYDAGSGNWQRVDWDTMNLYNLYRSRGMTEDEAIEAVAAMQTKRWDAKRMGDLSTHVTGFHDEAARLAYDDWVKQNPFEATETMKELLMQLASDQAKSTDVAMNDPSTWLWAMLKGKPTDEFMLALAESRNPNVGSPLYQGKSGYSMLPAGAIPTEFGTTTTTGGIQIDAMKVEVNIDMQGYNGDINEFISGISRDIAYSVIQEMMIQAGMRHVPG